MTDRTEAMRERVRALYERNRQQGHAPWCGLDYDFICPSSGTYPFQWFWDSGFHAIVLTQTDVARAQSVLTSASGVDRHCEAHALACLAHCDRIASKHIAALKLNGRYIVPAAEVRRLFGVVPAVMAAVVA